MKQKTETNRNSKKNERKMVFRKLPDIYEYKSMNKQKNNNMNKEKFKFNFFGLSIECEYPSEKTIIIIGMILVFLLIVFN